MAARAYVASRSFRLRLRFTGALLLLVLPLLAAAWGFGKYAASNERAKTDIGLHASLRTAATEFARMADNAQVKAVQLAALRRVQVALRDRDRAAIAALRKANPNTLFLVGEPPEKTIPGVVQRSANVLAGSRIVGSVVVSAPLDDAAVRRIAANSGLGPHDIAVAEREGRVVASFPRRSGSLNLPESGAHTVRLGDESYRAVSGALAPDTRLGILSSTDAVDAAASSKRRWIVLVGLAVLALVLPLAYSLAPALARSRVAQDQREIAERVLAHVADGVALLDPAGVVRFWNDAAEEITGLPSDAVLGERAQDVVPGWRAAAPQIPIGRADERDAGSTATVPLEIDGREIWLTASGVRFADGTVYTFRDISEEERLDQEKTDFVATVSHELRTPLASVYGAAITLRERFSALDPKRRDALLELLADQANRLSTIIDELLLASRLAGSLDSDQLDLEDGMFEPEEVARAVVDAARLHAPPTIQIELSAPPFLPPTTGDRDKVGQVLTNFVSNAVKYSPGGGRVDVAVEQDGERVRFAVSDEGLGIPLDEQRRIFKKFYRLDPNLTRGIGGTGLGLYICDALIRRMGGEIQVHSAPGRGSTFSFDLPVAHAAGRVAEPLGSH